MVCEFVFPWITVPKFALVGVTLKPACAPAPVTAATVLTPSLLVTVTLPDAAPAAVGLKVTDSVALWEGARLKGVATPLTDTPWPLAVTWLTVTLELPVFDSWIFWLALLPTFTLPKLR